jgi:tetratricopeptide (TPR) repeat protein
MLPPDEAGLGPQGEAEWARLKRQIELAEGFWLGFLFASSPVMTGSLCRRAERLLRGQTRRLSQHAPSRPEELSEVLRALLAPEAGDAGCHWIEALHLESAAQPERPWHQAWTKLIVLMNERRDALRRHLRGGLVLVAPPQMKPVFRQMASDFWSVRALVLELDPVAEPFEGLIRSTGETQGARSSLEAPGGAIPDVGFALAELERMLSAPPVSYRALAAVLTRAVEGLLASGRASDARDIALQTWDFVRARAREEPLNSARILQQLARAEAAVDDLASASEHLEWAAGLTRGKVDRQHFLLLYDAGRLAYLRRDLGEASRVYEEALGVCRQLLETSGETPEALRDLSVSLDNVGDVRRARGELAAAAQAYEESLELRRQLREALGETPEALRDLSVSLNRVGDVRRARGELAAAAQAYEESLALSRQVHEILGAIPQATEDLIYVLNRLAMVRRALGNEQAAQAAQAEADALTKPTG